MLELASSFTVTTTTWRHGSAAAPPAPGFAETVRVWERRLGELNVMVEAVEPPAELWDTIKANIETVSPGDQVSLAPTDLGTAGDTDSAAKTAAGSDEKSEAKALAALASTLMAPEGGAEGVEQAKEEWDGRGARAVGNEHEHALARDGQRHARFGDERPCVFFFKRGIG